MNIGPTFFSSPGGEGPIVPGTPTAALFGGNNNVLARITDTTALLVYQQNSGSFTTSAVIVTDNGDGTVTFGTPVQVSTAAGGLYWFSLHALDPAAGTFMCAYSALSGGSFFPHTRIITVTGSSITVTGTEDLVGNASTIPSTTLVGLTLAVISPTIVAMRLSASGGSAVPGDYVSIGTVSGGTTTWGAPVDTGVDGIAGRLLLGNGGVVTYGRHATSPDNRLWAASVSSGGSATPPYLTATIADRIHTPTSGSIPTISAQVSTGLHALVERTSGGGTYCTRAQLSGGVATYSNSDANPNLLSLSPYIAPVNMFHGTMVAAPSGSKVFAAYAQGTTWWGAKMGVSGNINMIADAIAITPSGASNFVPGLVYLTEFRAMLVWSSGGLLYGQVMTG